MPAKGTVFTLVLFAVIIAAVQLLTFSGEHVLLADYLAFWCAGSVLTHGGSPYLTAPLVACEYGQPWFHPYGGMHVAVPAPLPGYALLPFAALSYLPFPVAAVLWFLASLGALWFSAIALAELTGRNKVACAAIFVLPALLLWLPYGELAPFALAGSMLVAKGLRAGHVRAVLTGLLLLSLEPHLAAGVWVAAVIVARRMRVAITIAAATLAGVWLLLANAGPPVYFRDVLPLQALSHLPSDGQYSVTWMLHALGFSDAAALAVGSVSYVFFTVAALAVALILYKRTSDIALVPLFVIIGEVTGGTYVHGSHIAAALPAALWFSPFSAVLISVPWWQLSLEPTLAPFAACIGGLSSLFIGLLKRSATWFGILAFVALVAFVVLSKHGAFESRAFPVHSVYASADAGRYIWSHDARTDAASWLRKLPTWIALGIVWIRALQTALKPYASRSRQSPTSTSTASSAPAPNSTTVAAP